MQKNFALELKLPANTAESRGTSLAVNFFRPSYALSARIKNAVAIS
jgi:hypothetical protein